MQEEFYAVAFRKKMYDSFESLQIDFDEWLHYYNYDRSYSGRYCFGKTPMQTWLDSKELAKEKRFDQLYSKAKAKTTD